MLESQIILISKKEERPTNEKYTTKIWTDQTYIYGFLASNLMLFRFIFD